MLASESSLVLRVQGVLLLYTLLQAVSASFVTRRPSATVVRRARGADDKHVHGCGVHWEQAISSARRCNDGDGEESPITSAHPLPTCVPRRLFLDSCAIAPFIMMPVRASAEEVRAAAASSDDESSASNVARNRVASLLHAVPTFCIVDPKGVPYVVVGDDAKVTGYFFTRYEEADRILTVARTSADRAIQRSDERDAVNPWKGARISTIPLDVAATLVTKSLSSRTHFQIAPSESDIAAALNITGKASLAEGKVPLFYYEDWKDANNQSPLYFARDQLEQSFASSHKGKGASAAAQLPKPPQPNVTELFAVLTQIVQNPSDDELQQLVLVAPQGSASKAKECERRNGGKEPPFVLGQQILVL
jgi:Tic22-like family